MRFPLSPIALLVLPTLVWADGLSDLRASLQNLHGHAPLQVNVSYSAWQEATTFLRPVVSQGSIQLRVGEDGSGLHVDWKLPQLNPTTGEECLSGPDPKAAAQIRDATKDLDAERLDHLLNQADVLSRFIEGSRFEQELRETYQGQSARVLVFTFNQKIRPEHQGRVSGGEARLKIWIGEGGQPLGMESVREYQGKHSRLYGRFHNKSLVRTTYAILNQRLLVASRKSEDSLYDTGEKLKRTRTWVVAEVGSEPLAGALKRS
jgi:hypothetical protein